MNESQMTVGETYHVRDLSLSYDLPSGTPRFQVKGRESGAIISVHASARAARDVVLHRAAAKGRERAAERLDGMAARHGLSA